MLDSKLVEGLRQRSQNRISRSEFFAKEDRQIKRYEEQKDRKTVTLNKEKFLKERAELDADKEQEKLFDDMNDPKRPVYEMDGYGEEALDITVDYLDLLGRQQNRRRPPRRRRPASRRDSAVSSRAPT